MKTIKGILIVMIISINALAQNTFVQVNAFDKNKDELWIADMGKRNLKTTTQKSCFETEVLNNSIVYSKTEEAIKSELSVLDELMSNPHLKINKVNGNIEINGKTDILIFNNGVKLHFSNFQLSRFLQNTRAERVNRLEIIYNVYEKDKVNGNTAIIKIWRF